MAIFTDLLVIAATAPVVIGKRMLVFARGGRKARSEGRRAVSEKVGLAATSTASLASGGSFGKVVKRYRQKVQENARRL